MRDLFLLLMALSYLENKIKSFARLDEIAPSLVNKLAKYKIVMLGEASHGTEEYYQVRRMITEILIKDHGFNFVAVEGDWPDCYSMNTFIRSNEQSEAIKVLQSFKRWPTWMWSNTEVLKLMENLKKINSERKEKDKVGFYGLDVYSLFESIDVVISEIEKINPELGQIARYRYSCFSQFNKNEKEYLHYLQEVPEGCREGAVKMLVDLLKIRLDKLSGKNGDIDFNIKQNAKIVLHAEDYYRTMILGNDDSWNVRDRHMTDTLDSIFETLYPNGKAIIWAHNTHIGDYKYTDMKSQGQINLGGLVREKYGEDVALVGFGTYKGSVIASNKWGGKIKKLPVPHAKKGSYDEYLHSICAQLRSPICVLNFVEMNQKESEEFSKTRGQRAIGVVYHPAYEYGNYVATNIAKRYDYFIFIDETKALIPIMTREIDEKEIPEDYPFNA